VKPSDEKMAEGSPDGQIIAFRKSVANLNKIGFALYRFRSRSDSLPAHAIYDDSGKPLLSWRVALLPFLGESDLFEEFHLNEPWDSEHNRQLLPRMPEVYRSFTPQAERPNETTYLAPIGKDLMFTGESTGTKYKDAVDGFGNSAVVVQVETERAVPWTSPQDFPVDLAKPARGFANYPERGYLLAFSDWHVARIAPQISDKSLAGLFTRSAKDGVALEDRPYVIPEQPPREQGFSLEFLGLETTLMEKLGVPKLVRDGIGNQAGLHVYDAIPTFDFNLSSFLSDSLSNSGGRGAFSDYMIPISFLLASLNAPVYVSVPVQDEQIVDGFLEKLDNLYARRARRETGFGIDTDFYRYQGAEQQVYRCQGLSIGPWKLRIYWARIGKGLYIASKPFILDDLVALAGQKPAASHGPEGHALLKVRAQNWNQVLPDFRLGWAENNRVACLDNLGPLTTVARSNRQLQSNTEVCRCADSLYGCHFFCPEGGKYVMAKEGRSIECTLHGTAAAPRQAQGPAKDQSLGKLIGEFQGMEAALTFLEDGLHAVLTIRRK
jgi:Protein of unknown function (DUF1559)